MDANLEVSVSKAVVLDAYRTSFHRKPLLGIDFLQIIGSQLSSGMQR